MSQKPGSTQTLSEFILFKPVQTNLGKNTLPAAMHIFVSLQKYFCGPRQLCLTSQFNSSDPSSQFL